MKTAVKRVVVMGLGRFGGGVGVAKYLAARGADVLVTDLLRAGQLHESMTELDGLPIRYRLGGHDVGDFTQADLIVVNPSVDRRGNEYLRAAQGAGATLTSEIRLLIDALPNRHHVIGVTGTTGKSTVTAMLSHVLTKHHSPTRVHIGGNIGGSLLGCLDQIKNDHLVVLELSSFMLDDLDDDHWSPGIAVVTNFAPNHLDRHTSIEDYAAAKQVILKYQERGDTTILGPTATHWPTNTGVTRHAVAGHDARIVLGIPGTHNRVNATLAYGATQAIGVSGIDPAHDFADFVGLPHRLQFVCEYNNIRFYNDSKATTPEAVQFAIESLIDDPVVVATPGASSSGVLVILGGYDKGHNLTALGELAGHACRAVFTIGATGDAIADAAQRSGCANVMRCGSLDRAVEAASQQARPGDAVLLSPGCASWDQFENYEKRGAAFVEAILKYNTQRQP